VLNETIYMEITIGISSGEHITSTLK